jgi:hypothetical protein
VSGKSKKVWRDQPTRLFYGISRKRHRIESVSLNREGILTRWDPMLRYAMPDGADVLEAVTTVFELADVVDMLPGREYPDSPKIRNLQKKLFEMKSARLAS